MPWELSHSDEAIGNACERIYAMATETLVEIYGESLAAYDEDGAFDASAFDQSRYNAAIAHAATLSGEVLADYIVDRALDHGLTTNGGHHLYACPSGCHLVSFEPLAEEDSGDE